MTTHKKNQEVGRPVVSTPLQKLAPLKEAGPNGRYKENYTPQN